MKRSNISVLINTYNEEKNIRNCLETVKWVNEIIIVDMHSEDRTVEIAKEYTDKIFYFENMGYADPARQFALEQAVNEWILVVDADELVPKRLRDKLLNIMDNDTADIAVIPRTNYFFGYLMEKTGWGALQDGQPRFFKKNFITFSDKVHSIFNINSDARIYRIENSEEGFIHFNYIDVEHFLEKMNRYTTIEAKNMFNGKKNKPESMTKEIYYLIKEFGDRFFRRKGYRDGFYGFYLSVLMVAYRASSFLKLRIMEKYKAADPGVYISQEYNNIVKNIIDDYKTGR